MAKRAFSPASPSLDWLERDHHVIEGLDHLGIEVVSINLYALLLPGITNVSDRLRYHAFYPWVLDQFAQQAERGRRAWREWIRRLDFALALASAAHEKSVDENESAIVGAITARRLLRDAKERDVIDFRSFVDLDEKDRVSSGAYFKNGEGGLGQYYKGPGTELGLFVPTPDHANPNLQLTTYAGVPIARTASLAFSSLLEVAEKRRARVKDLARLGETVSPSAIPEGSVEENLLRQLVLEDGTDLSQGQEPASRKMRRRSLLLCLHYVERAGGIKRAELTYEFRWGCHARRLPDGSAWQVPAELEAVRIAWGSYQRNDTMNFALEVLLWACLCRLDDQPLRLARLVRDVVGAATAPIAQTNDRSGSPALKGSVDRWLSMSRGPTPLSDTDIWGDTSTWSWCDALEEAVHEEDHATATAWAVRVLGRLATDRGPEDERPFATLAGAEEMAAVHDVTFARWLTRTRERAQETIQGFLSDLLLEWVLFRHLRVATRKLAAQGVSTFKFRPEEGVLLLLTSPPRPTQTTPRLRQAFRFLEDLHYIKLDGDVIKIAPDGAALLKTLT